jgi:hypothetical protein
MTPAATLGLGLLAAAAGAARALAGPAIASDWATLKGTQAECLDRGETAIRRLGFGPVERTRYSRFGVSNDYTVSVRCIPEKGVVLFLAAGLSRARALELQIELHRNDPD